MSFSFVDELDATQSPFNLVLGKKLAAEPFKVRRAAIEAIKEFLDSVHDDIDDAGRK